jgi:hypothetical protein
MCEPAPSFPKGDDVKNIISGNARVGLQAGNVQGFVSVGNAGQVTVNGFPVTPGGTYLVDGVSVGTPARSGCGCPGADTFYFENDVRVCCRCGNPLD